ncbi:hypothetical protein ACE0DR_11590 [Azotobacter sp. CWF10]
MEKAATGIEENRYVFGDDGINAQIGRMTQTLLGLPANAPYVVRFGDSEVRGYTDGNGKFEVFLPAEQAFEIQVYDVRFDAVGTYRGVTEPSGTATQIPALGYISVTDLPDSDGDALRDIVELIVGTDSTKSDTDIDGISDFLEVKTGEDPRGGFSLPTGIIANLPLAGNAQGIFISTGLEGVGTRTAFITLGDSGLAVVDISNATNPALRAVLSLPGDAQSIDFDQASRIAAVTTGSTLELVSLNDLSSPRVLSSIGVAAQSVQVLDGIAYVSAGSNLHAYELSTAEELGSLSLGSSLTGLAQEDNFLYAIDTNGVLKVVQLGGDGSMTVVGSLSLADESWIVSSMQRDLYVADGVLYIPADNEFQGGYATVDVSNSAAPALISGPDATNIGGDAIALNGSGSGVIVGNPGGVGATPVLDVINTTDPENTGNFVTRINLPSAPEAVALGGALPLWPRVREDCKSSITCRAM